MPSIASNNGLQQSTFGDYSTSYDPSLYNSTLAPASNNAGTGTILGGSQGGVNVFSPVSTSSYSSMLPSTGSGVPSNGTQPNLFSSPTYQLPGMPATSGAVAPPPLYQPGGTPSTYNSPASNLLGANSGNDSYLKDMLSGTDPSWLSQLMSPGSGNQALQDIVNGKGNPFDATQTWQAMVDAQQRQLQENSANLTEKFNTMGGRFSSSYGNALGDYWTQAGKDENSLLGQLQMASYEASQNRNLSAAGQLSSQDLQSRLAAMGIKGQAAQQLADEAFKGTSQLSSQDFQNQMLQAAQAFQASQQASSQSTGAAQSLQAGGVAGATALHNTSVGAANALMGSENTAAGQIYSGQQQQMIQGFAAQLQASGMDANTANALASQFFNQTGQGQSIGQSQYTIGQSQTNNAYQEWLRTQPEYNTLMSQINQAGSSYPPQYFQQPGLLAQYGPAIAGLLAAAPGLIKILFPNLTNNTSTQQPTQQPTPPANTGGGGPGIIFQPPNINIGYPGSGGGFPGQTTGTWFDTGSMWSDPFYNPFGGGG